MNLSRLRLAVFAIFLFAFRGAAAEPPALRKITINYATRTGTSWPLYIAKEAGYFQKYGLDVSLAFAVHPAAIAMVISGEAAMTNYPLEQAMLAGANGGALTIVASPYRKSLFALMSGRNVGSVRDLKGKRIGVSQIGDAPYNYAVGLLGKFGLTPRDVEWVPIGTDVNGRAAALIAGRVDATMITAPVYFRLEEQGYKSLANTSDYDDLYAPTVYVFRKSTVASDPKLPELLIKAHTEAIKRFYEDKDFALKAYMKYTPEKPAELARVYDRYAKTNTFERVPYVVAASVQYMIDHAVDERAAAQMKSFDFRTVIDNSTVDRLVREGWFEKLFGPGIKDEEDRKKKLAFR
ncbi:MAG TPA: ABC transporter substrate-binding protein [Bryobacteraceae bacterium]|jgi:ABC-type nitrate/sulfonate/bicarbonate transport system substrate-binding protein|nr:ABC transporter substrate-binding protein [Bryobacteraceae bacterium]